MNLIQIDEALSILRSGKPIIVIDDEDRENEGDLVVLAEKITPELINFMASECKGLICLTLTREKCKKLNLTPMVPPSENRSKFSTNFMISIEAKEGVSTGISAHDRAHTILTAVNKNATPVHIVTPGHIFPLQAVSGGTLIRAGHTEAGCDLAKMANAIEPASVIVEILNSEGKMAKGKELTNFSKKFDIPIISINQIIKTKLKNERTVSKISERTIDSNNKQFLLETYHDSISGSEHYSLFKKGDGKEKIPLVRVHLANFLVDNFAIGSTVGPSTKSTENKAKILTFNNALNLISDYNGDGVLIIISQNSSVVFQNLDGTHSERSVVRQTGIGAQILNHLGIKEMDVIGNPKSYPAITAYGLRIRNYISY